MEGFQIASRGVSRVPTMNVRGGEPETCRISLCGV